MRGAFLAVIVGLLAACDAMVPSPIPPIDYDTQDVRGVMRWVSRWVGFESDGINPTIAPPWVTYDRQLGNCEDISILAMYLLQRDLGIDSAMAVYLTPEGFHARVAVDGEYWEPQIGLRTSAEPLYTIPYDNAMALAGVR